MPLREFICPKCGKFESYVSSTIPPPTRPCPNPKCKERGKLVEFSVPARRNPDKGIQT